MPLKKRILPALLMAGLCWLLGGCAVPTVDQLYQVPRRPESYNAMESVFNSAMTDLEYSAPRNGSNLQTIQMADLDGDGIREYLIFAKGEGDKPLRILIFAQQGEEYRLADTLECGGAYFDRVEYVPMDGQPGEELVVGTRISEQVYRSLGVYSFREGAAQPLMTASYVRFITCDLDTDGQGEILVLKPGITDQDYGDASLYRIREGMALRSNEVALSCPVDRVSRILSGSLADGSPGVFVSGSDEESIVYTDALALEGDRLTNPALLVPGGTAMKPFGEQQVYPMDIDGDGQLELPGLVRAREPNGAMSQRLVCWYSLATDGGTQEKVYAYHDYDNGWYLQLQSQWIPQLRLKAQSNTVAFYMEDPGTGTVEKIFSVYILTGQNREEDALLENRFILHQEENVIYAARLEVASGALPISQEDLINSFHPVTQGWKSGET